MSEKIIYYVSEVLPSAKENSTTHVRRVFRFPLDGDSEFNYRMRVSANAFFFSTTGRNWKGKMDPNRNNRALYAAKREDEFITYSSSTPHVIIDLKDIWEFYKSVGYDYKRKKWTETT